MIHQVTRLPMLEKPKATKNLPWAELIEKIGAEWGGREMKPTRVTNMEINFAIHIISHKMYNSSWPNNVACEAVDLAYKVVKKDLYFDLVELQLV